MTNSDISLVFGAFSGGSIVGFGIGMLIRFLCCAWRGFVKVAIDD